MPSSFKIILDSSNKTLYCNFPVVPACHYLVLYGCNKLLSLALSTLSANKSWQHKISLKFFWDAEKWTRDRWVRSKNAIRCAMQPIHVLQPYRWFCLIGQFFLKSLMRFNSYPTWAPGTYWKAFWIYLLLWRTTKPSFLCRIAKHCRNFNIYQLLIVNTFDDLQSSTTELGQNPFIADIYECSLRKFHQKFFLSFMDFCRYCRFSIFTIE